MGIICTGTALVGKLLGCRLGFIWMSLLATLTSGHMDESVNKSELTWLNGTNNLVTSCGSSVRKLVECRLLRVWGDLLGDLVGNVFTSVAVALSVHSVHRAYSQPLELSKRDMNSTHPVSDMLAGLDKGLELLNRCFNEV